MTDLHTGHAGAPDPSGAGRTPGLPDRRPLLIVSLPRNDVSLARAARDGGADVLKVHVNVRHLASGTPFGSLADERPRLEPILALGRPTGLVPGEREMLSPEEMPLIRAMGFAFLDAFVDTMRPHLYDAGIPVIPSLPHSDDERFVRQARDMPGDWVEAAIVPPDGYGCAVEEADFIALRRVGEATGKRLIVPTQRRVTVADVPRYFAIPQVHALMIGAVVTGLEAGSLHAATVDFRKSLDRITSHATGPENTAGDGRSR